MNQFGTQYIWVRGNVTMKSPVWAGGVAQVVECLPCKHEVKPQYHKNNSLYNYHKQTKMP
jgi:hypothetical protein